MFDVSKLWNTKLAALALLLIAICILWLAVVTPVIEWYGSQGEKLVELKLRIQREAAYVATTHNMNIRHTLIPTPLDRFLPTGTDAIASARLQDELQAIAQNARAQLLSIETLTAEDVGGYRRIGLRVTMTEDSDSVIRMLRLLDSTRLVLLIDNIMIAVQPNLSQAETLPLNVTFSIYAFISPQPQRAQE